MIADDGSPILMDFGSTMKARIKVENRQQALLQQVSTSIYGCRLGANIIIFQDIAAEQSTMAYRAPELFDVKTGITLDEKVDIWVRHPASRRLISESELMSGPIVIGVHTFRTCVSPFSL